MRHFIVGTDWWTDCDDAVAMRLLARAAKRGEIAIDGIVINACMEDSVASLDGFLTLEGVENIPLGLDAAGTDFGGNPPYQKRLAPFSKAHCKNEDAKDAVRLYRELLEKAKEPLEIIEIGYLQAFVALMESEADDISSKTGLELLREKASKCWVMAGKWDKDGERENNFCRNPRARIAAEAFCRKCPVPVVFLGWEVGFDVISGSRLDPADHLAKALSDHGSANGRSSWDPMLVLLALLGDAEMAGYALANGKARVDEETGANYFAPLENGPHAYVIKQRENAFYADMIDARL